MLERFRGYLDQPLSGRSRLALVLATLLLAGIYVSPLWQMTMFAPQYPRGLRLIIYSYALDGGNNGQDVKEINQLNHYIGMRALAEEDFTEFKWMPFVIGILGLLFLRAAVHGKVAHVLDVFVLYVYFSAFSLGTFAYRLYRYGHELSPIAAVKVDPFMPPLFGYQRIANFEVYSYPGPASYALASALAVIALVLIIEWHVARGGPPGARA